MAMLNNQRIYIYIAYIYIRIYIYIYAIYIYILWLFNIAMENEQFIDDVPTKSDDFPGR
jgi:hypothetical protein